jgi:hypothetical protein
MNQILKFDGLKRHFLLFFSSPHFIAIIDIFHIISKNILDNSDSFSQRKNSLAAKWSNACPPVATGYSAVYTLCLVILKM